MYFGYSLLHVEGVVFHAPDIVLEWIGFVTTFIMLGAVGFYFAVLRRARDLSSDLRRAIAARTARLGAFATIGKIVVVLVSVGLAYVSAPVAEQGKVLDHLSAPLSVVMFLALIAAVLAYGVAAVLNWPSRGAAGASGALPRGGSSAGAAGASLSETGVTVSSVSPRDGWAWEIAALAVTLAVLRNLFLRRWVSMINPLHEFAGGLWLGTLFVLIVAGVGTLMRRDAKPETRGKVVASLVNAFSPFALGAAGLLVVMGVWTAVRHLKRFDALWTTPYGITFIVKLVFVVSVLALGAWNWRRIRPRLGDMAVAEEIQRSAKRELTVAAIVLLVTAILVGMPVPR